MSPSLLLIASLIGAACAAAPTGSAPDRAFLKKAIEGDNSEIMLGRLAQERASGAPVKSFGAMLVSDHTQAREQASGLASHLGVRPPSRPMPEASQERAKFERLSGAAFDAEFVRYMVQDHEKDIADFRKEADSGSGATADLARKTLPVLQKHLSTAQNLTH